MEDLVVYALWIWIAVSILAFLVQLVRRWRYRRTVAAGGDVDLAGSGVALAGAASDAASADTAPSASTAPSTSTAPSATTAPSTASAPTVTSRPLDSKTVEEPVDAPPRRPEITTATPTAERGEVSAGPIAETAAPEDDTAPVDETQPVVDDRREEAAPDVTIASLIRGLRLPNGLAPIDAALKDAVAGDHAVRLRTESAPAAVAGAAFADEVERGGYEIMSISDDEAVARRGDDLFSMKIRPITIVAEQADADTSPEVSEVVEIDLWVGGGPSPFA